MSVTTFPIARRWFTRRRIDDDITLIWEPHVAPLGRCNIWHVRGSEADLLVDTGMGIAQLRPAIEDLFGHDVIAFATHTHFDHVGSLHEFEHRLVSRHEAALMAAGDAEVSRWLFRDGMDPSIRDAIEQAGYRIDDCLIDALPQAGWNPRAWRIHPARPTRAVDEGDTVSLGRRRFEVLHLPGHSPGSVGLWEAETGVLFSGDAVYDGPLLDRLPESDLNAYARTMERLMALPVTVVHAGHDPSFGRERLRQICHAWLEARPGS